METTKLSSKGQVIIPKPIRASVRWESGQELVVIDLGDSVLLKPRKPFQETSVDEVAACLRYKGKPKTSADLEKAIAKGIKERRRAGN